MSFTIGSLFDGSGGFPLAAFLCGGIPVWASEIEPYPIAVTRSRFPYMKHLGSVTDIRGNEIEPVDVITFGSPCQDLSVAGKRAGLKHEVNGDDETTRSGLFMEAVRIIREMREATNGEYPNFAVWENVPGAFSSNKGEDFRIVLEELIKICEPRAVMPNVPRKGWAYADCYRGDGWSLAYRVFDAQYWGVPQRRRRIYLVLDLTGQRAGQVLFERDGLRGYFAEGRSPWKGVTPNVAGGAGADGDAGSNSGALTAAGFPLGFRPENTRVYGEKASTICNGTRPGFCNGVICVATQQGGAEISESDVCPTVTASAGMSGNNQPWICYRECAGFKTGQSKDARGIGYACETSPTLSSDPGGNSVPGVCVKCVGVLASSAVNAETTDGTISPCLMARAGTGGNQLPLIAVEKKQYLFENHSQDTRYRGPLNVCPIVSATFGMGGNNQPFVVEQNVCESYPTYCIDGDKIGKAERSGGSGLGVRESNKMYTLTAKDAGTHAVAFQTYQKVTGPLMANSHPGSYTGQDAYSDMLIAGKEKVPVVFDKELYNSGISCSGGHYISEGGPSPTLRTCIPPGVCVRYIVRRLTPTECARLQGFADDWAVPERKESLSDEEYTFWLEVRNRHVEINGKQTKDYTRDQMLRWYNKLHTDSSEYKLWGNGIALPCALYVMQGIAEIFGESHLCRRLAEQQG